MQCGGQVMTHAICSIPRRHCEEQSDEAIHSAAS